MQTTRLRRFRPRLEVLEDRSAPATLLKPGFVDEPVVSGLSRPTSMAFAPDGRLFVTEQGGSLRVVKDGALLTQPFLTVDANSILERGLLGLAFDPDFASNRFIYVYYTVNAAPPVNRISRFTASSSNPDVVQAGSETVLLDDIPSTNGNHNGGALHFGTDGMLYIGVGDAGVSNNSQSLGSLSGKLLRIRPDGTVPGDNPFVGTPNARGEIWALGFRNPFTFNVEAGTGRIFVNDVGDDAFEEIDDLRKGGNYGWPTTEGPTSDPAFIGPLFAYPHAAGEAAAIAGGVFYEASQFPAAFQGSYFYGDFVHGDIHRLTSGTFRDDAFATGAIGIVDLDTGPDGSLYHLSLISGTVSRMRFTSAGGSVIALGAGPGSVPLVRVLDAETLQPRLQILAYEAAFPGGVRVAVGDVNADGVADIITGAGPGGAAHVKVFDGTSGQEIRSFFAHAPAFRGGVSVAAGDVNGDGVADIITGAGPGGGPHVLVFDGVNGALLASFLAFEPRFPGGIEVAARDINGDLRTDIIVGAGPGGAPHVKAFDGARLAELRSFFAAPTTFAGGVHVGAALANSGSEADLLTGLGLGGLPLVQVHDGLTLALLDSFFAFEPSFLGGAFVAG